MSSVSGILRKETHESNRNCRSNCERYCRNHKEQEEAPYSIVMYAVISSIPRKAGSAGVEHRRSDSQSAATNNPVPPNAAITALSGWYHRATSNATPKKQTLPTNKIASAQ